MDKLYTNADEFQRSIIRMMGEGFPAGRTIWRKSSNTGAPEIEFRSLSKSGIALVLQIGEGDNKIYEIQTFHKIHRVRPLVPLASL